MYAIISLAVVEVLTQHYDLARTGANLDETVLTPAAVGGGGFGKLFTRDVDGMVYAQPLYVAGLMLPGGPRNVVFVATMHNSVYAFDADDPLAQTPIWQASLETPIALPDPNIGFACRPSYKDISVEIGILSTPVIDPVAGVIYVVAASHDENGYQHHLHALDLATGADRLGGPVTISAALPGTGAGAVNGTIEFQSQYEDQRPALLLTAGRIYIGFASYCDTEPCHGWLMPYDATTLAAGTPWIATADGDQGGVWQSGQGLSVDAAGNIYMVTGDGPFNYDTGGRNLGDTVIRMSPDLDVLDWFTPYDYETLYTDDLDLGTSGAVLMPGTNAVIAGGKAGKIYILDRANLGHLANLDDQILESIPLSASAHIYASPVSWIGPDGPTTYIWAGNDALRGYHWNGTDLDATPFSMGELIANGAVPGGMLTLSANGTADGVLWANVSVNGNANQALVAGVLRAYDAGDLTHELWDSEQNAARDATGTLAKFNSAVVVAGKVYLGTFANQLVVYGMLTSSTRLQASAASTSFGDSLTLTAHVTSTGAATPTGFVSFADGATTLGNTRLDATATATFTTSTLAAGTHALSATYEGNVTSNPSAPATIAEIVSPAPCTASLTAQPTTILVGNPVVLSAQIATPPPLAAGAQVVFADGAAALGSAPLQASETATLALVSLDMGHHEITASYAGDANHQACASASVAVSSTGEPTVSVVATPDPAPIAAPIDLAITVAGVAGMTPTGVVSVSEGATPVDNAFLDTAGVAHVTYSSSVAGAHSLDVTYAGDGEYTSAGALPLVVTIVPAPEPSTTVLGGNGPFPGEVYRLVATVTAAAPVTGVVNFLDGATVLGQVPIGAGGQAMFTTPTLAVGAHTFTADYLGDAEFAASHSQPFAIEISVVVTPDANLGPPAELPPSMGGCSLSTARGGHGIAAILVGLALAVVAGRRRRRQ